MSALPTPPDIGAEPPVRSALFVPANRRSWIEKVHHYQADAVVLDLEDATLPRRKDEARKIVQDAIPLLREQGQSTWVRVNELRSTDISRDLEVACRDGVDLICLPKVRDPDDIRELDRMIGYHEGANGLPLGTLGIYPLLETAQALLNAAGVFAASTRVCYAGAVTSPGADVEFAVGYRWTESFLETLYLRSAALLAARACGIANPVTGLVTALDAGLVRRFAEHSRDIGYAGMFVIHPTHVAIANEIFTPTQEAYAWSREILDGYALDLDADRGTMLDSRGGMVDYAMIRVAQLTAARYEFFAQRAAR